MIIPRSFVCSFVLVLLSSPVLLRAKDKSDSETCNDEFTQRGDDLDGAISKVSVVIKANPQSWVCFLDRAALYLGQDNFPKAIADASRAIELSRGKEPQPYTIRARSHLGGGQYTEALADIDSALSREKKDGFDHYIRGKALYFLQRNDEALNALELALKYGDQLDSSSKRSIYAYKGFVLFDLQRYAETIRELDLCLNGDDDQPDEHWIRGISAWKLGQFDKARTDANYFLEHVPSLVETGGSHCDAL